MLQGSRHRLSTRRLAASAEGAPGGPVARLAFRALRAAVAIDASRVKAALAHRAAEAGRKLKHLANKVVEMASRGRAASREPEGERTDVRWLAPSEIAPRGRAPGARSRLLTTRPDGTRTHVLILAEGDEVWTALTDFARAHRVVNAHFSAIGAVRDVEVAWFDVARKQYKAMSLPEQLEVLMLSGDIALGADDHPVVHAHVALGRSDGSARGGHLLHAVASPTLELYVTTYPEPLYKRLDPAADLQLIDPSLRR